MKKLDLIVFLRNFTIRRWNSAWTKEVKYYFTDGVLVKEVYFILSSIFFRYHRLYGASRARQAFVAMTSVYNNSYNVQDLEMMPKGKTSEILTVLENTRLFPVNSTKSKIYHIIHHETYGKYSVAQELNAAFDLPNLSANLEHNANIKLVVLESRLRDFLRVLDKTVKSETPRQDKLEKFKVFEEEWQGFGESVLEKHPDKTFVIMLDNPVGAEIEKKDEEEVVKKKVADRKFGQTLIQMVI